MMEWTILALLLCSTPSLANYSASACYGSGGSCYFLYLNCYAGLINILSAVYLFAAEPSCRNQGKSCDSKTSKGCCKAENGKWPTDFTKTDMQKLFADCNGRQNCNVQAPWIQNAMTSIFSSLVEVRYECKNDDAYTTLEQTTPKDNSDRTASESRHKQTTSENKIHADPDTLVEDDNSNTAAVVVPVVVLLIVAVAIVLFIYWRRKQQGQLTKSGIIGDTTLNKPVQNEAYFTTDKNKSVLANTADNETPEDTYQTIDPNSIPDYVAVEDKTVDSGPQDNYHMTDPNKKDFETPASHDYFILESQAATYAHNEDASEYNRIQLDTRKIVADPNYHRLGTVDRLPCDNTYNYNHKADGLHNKVFMTDGITENAQPLSYDDCSHLAC